MIVVLGYGYVVRIEVQNEGGVQPLSIITHLSHLREHVRIPWNRGEVGTWRSGGSIISLRPIHISIQLRPKSKGTHAVQ